MAAVTLLVVVTIWPLIAAAQQSEQSIDSETWVYENVYRDGKLQFKNLEKMLNTQPNEVRSFTVFVDNKLGCKPAISEPNGDLTDDFFSHFIFGPDDMEIIEDHYVIANSYMYSSATNKGLVILDVQNRWAAFAMTHSEDFWNYEDGKWAGRMYSEEFQKHYYEKHFSLFLVDETSNIFVEDAKLLARRWVDGFSLSEGRYVDEFEDLRYYPDDLPMNVYEIRCDQQALSEDAVQ